METPASGTLKPWDPPPNFDAEDSARLTNAETADAKVIPKDPEVPESVARLMYIRKGDTTKYGETQDAWGAGASLWANRCSPTPQLVVKKLKDYFVRLRKDNRDWEEPMIESRRRLSENRRGS